MGPAGGTGLKPKVGGYPDLAGGTLPADSDHDGMPDQWERQMNLNPNDDSDGSTDSDADGYTNIEEYLHSLPGHG
jgi:hypothetical protein